VRIWRRSAPRWRFIGHAALRQQQHAGFVTIRLKGFDVAAKLG